MPRWPDALEQITELLGSTASTVGFMDTSARMGWRTQARIDERAVADYLDHYRPLDPTMRLV